MTQDLLKLAEECERIATEQDVDAQIYELTTCGAEMLARCTIALREAHAEIERLRAELEAAREAYTNRGTERDCALVECDNLRAANATLRAELEAAQKAAKSALRRLIVDISEECYSAQWHTGIGKRLLIDPISVLGGIYENFHEIISELKTLGTLADGWWIDNETFIDGYSAAIEAAMKEKA